MNWSVEHFFWVGLLLLCCCTHPKVMTRMAKKCSTDQRFIRKINTTYKIFNSSCQCNLWTAPKSKKVVTWVRGQNILKKYVTSFMVPSCLRRSSSTRLASRKAAATSLPNIPRRCAWKFKKNLVKSKQSDVFTNKQETNKTFSDWS